MFRQLVLLISEVCIVMEMLMEGWWNDPQQSNDN